jgi:transposase
VVDQVKEDRGMMGPRQDRKGKLFYVGVNIEERVDSEHPLRKIAAVVDFGFVRRAVAGRYGVKGNPSLDPILLLKMLFLLFYENVSSERELMRQLPCRLDWLWFLSMDLDSAIPDHSVLSKARRRWGQEVFAGFFKKVLRQCVAAGLVDGARVHIDGSLIAADADAGKLTLALHLEGEAFYGRLEAAGKEAACAAAGTAAGVTVPAAAADTAACAADFAIVPAATEAGAGLDDAKPAAELPPAIKRVAAGTLYSRVDPEARLTRKYGRSVLGYKDHRVVDDRCGIITATLTTPANVAESSMLMAAMDSHEANTGLLILEPVADKGYGTVENYCLLKERRTTPVIPHPAVREDKSKFSRGLFVYDPGRDVYTCPAGQSMHRRGEASEDRYRYLAQAGVCQSCPLRRQCTAGKVRVLSRQVRQDAIDWADSRLNPAQRRSRMRRRKIRAEGSFADAANHHGYKQARWRGLEKMTIQNSLIAAIQNVRKLIRRGKKAPQTAAERRRCASGSMEQLCALSSMSWHAMKRFLIFLGHLWSITVTYLRSDSRLDSTRRDRGNLDWATGP